MLDRINSQPSFIRCGFGRNNKSVRDGILKEFLYADDLVPLGDSWFEIEERNGKLTKALNNKT